MPYNEAQYYLIKELLYKGKNRGCKEMCVILGQFAEKHLHTMNMDELQQFNKVLEQSDVHILDWFSNQKAINLQNSVIEKLLNFKIELNAQD